MNTADLPPNHHADYPQFTGVFGYLAGLTMVFGRSRDARLVTAMADVTATDRVVDIGCGPGTAVRLTAGRGATVTGVDPSEPMLRLARLLTLLMGLRRSAGEITWVRAGAEDMPLPDASFDVCWSLATVHHWPDLEAGLDEVERVLGPGGTFIALEKQAAPGATGNASHGWTPQQAETFAEMLRSRNYTPVEVTNHNLGRRQVVTVAATAPHSGGQPTT